MNAVRVHVSLCAFGIHVNMFIPKVIIPNRFLIFRSHHKSNIRTYTQLCMLPQLYLTPSIYLFRYSTQMSKVSTPTMKPVESNADTIPEIDSVPQPKIEFCDMTVDMRQEALNLAKIVYLAKIRGDIVTWKECSQAMKVCIVCWWLCIHYLSNISCYTLTILYYRRSLTRNSVKLGIVL